MAASSTDRFVAELEFVQCLANPNYLHCMHLNSEHFSHSFTRATSDLAQHGYFEDERFINYLTYLRYWKQPEYARYIKSVSFQYY